MPHRVDYPAIVWASGALLVRDAPFTLRSGRQSRVYANHRNLVCLPDALAVLTNALVKAAQSSYPAPFAFSTVDSSVSPLLVAAAATLADIPAYSYRPVSREKGLSDDLFAYDKVETSKRPPRLPAVVVDDVVTTTQTLATAATALDEHGIVVLGGACILDRRTASDRAADPMAVVAVASLADVLRYGLAKVDLTNEDRRNISLELMTLDN